MSAEPAPAAADVDEARARVADAETRLDATLDGLTDELAAEPSLLPGWTRGVLVRHIAVNAWSNAAMIDAALRGEHRPQYPGGDDERTELIEQGRGRPAAEVVADARAAAAELRAVLDRVGDWTLTVPAGVGPRTVFDRLLGRRVEVEMHHVDLGLGYTPADWPEDFAPGQLERLVAALPDRAATGMEPGVWRFTAAGVGSWDVAVAEPLVRVGAADEEEARGEVSGPPYAVLAWLAGRSDAAALGLEVRGDDTVAQLPSWFPWT